MSMYVYVVCIKYRYVELSNNFDLHIILRPVGPNIELKNCISDLISRKGKYQQNTQGHHSLILNIKYLDDLFLYCHVHHN